MLVSNKTLEKLTDLINEKTIYRSGPTLVEFFNRLGFNDCYGRVFPSRRDYTLDHLQQINGKPELDACIRNLFAPIKYVENMGTLDGYIDELNKYLAFDGWKVVRNNATITFAHTKVDVDAAIHSATAKTEEEFLSFQYKIDIENLPIEDSVKEIIKSRIDEIVKCMECNAPLSAIFLSGSTLEGVLMSVGTRFPRVFNTAKTSPKKDGKVRLFQEWSLKDYIDVSAEIGLIQKDVQMFSHSLQNFRNYIHPYEQMCQRFTPDLHTAAISVQVLKAAIFQVEDNISKIRI